MGLAEDRELDRQLTECLRNGPSVQLVNDLTPIQPGDWVGMGVSGDPNKTVQDLPHVDTIREKLRAGAKDENADPTDREAARQALKIMYRESVTGQQETDQICKAILKAFKDSEYLNIADFRLLAKGSDSQTLTAAIEYLIENEYIVELDSIDFDDLDAGNAETIYARIVPIGNHGQE
jgi:hypothetical protein